MTAVVWANSPICQMKKQTPHDIWKKAMRKAYGRQVRNLWRASVREVWEKVTLNVEWRENSFPVKIS